MSDHEREKPAEKSRLICTKTSHVLLKYLSGIERPQLADVVIDKFKEIEEKDPFVRVYGGSVSEFEMDLTYLEALGLIKIEKIKAGEIVEATALGKYFSELFRTPEFLRAEFEEQK